MQTRFYFLLICALSLMNMRIIANEDTIPGVFQQERWDLFYLPGSESLNADALKSRVVIFDLKNYQSIRSAQLSFDFIDIDPLFGYKLDMVSMNVRINGQIVDIVSGSNSSSYIYREIAISNFFFDNQHVLAVVFENNRNSQLFDGVLIKNIVLKVSGVEVISE